MKSSFVPTLALFVLCPVVVRGQTTQRELTPARGHYLQLEAFSGKAGSPNEEIDKHWNGRLKHLSEFSFAVPAGKGICGTVDSFQGNEADLVIVSLVRNNHHSNVRNALGFLTGFRRMNVLLSRARWRLVLVGSREFLEAVLKSAKGTEQEVEIKFLQLFLNALADEEKEKMAVTISEATLQGLAT